MGKSREQKQQQNINLDISRQQQQAQMQAMQQAQEQQAWADLMMGRQEEIYGQISPFAKEMLKIGQGALSGQIPQSFVDAFKLPARNALSSAYGGARGNLMEMLGSSGQLGSGLASGPLAAFEQNQAQAFGESDANASLQALMQALGLGGQGASLLSGQQQMFNPLAYGQQAQGWGQIGIGAGSAGSVDPRQYARAGGGILGSLLGGGVSALTGGLLGGSRQNSTSSITGGMAGTPWAGDVPYTSMPSTGNLQAPFASWTHPNNQRPDWNYY
jgi:hypothetical protein